MLRSMRVVPKPWRDGGFTGGPPVSVQRSRTSRPAALVSSRQLNDALEGVARLASQGELVLGTGQRHGAKGFFLSPTLVRAADGATAVHEHEVFGPVGTLVACDDDAPALVARGNGGLVSSIYSEDQAYIESIVEEMAPHHGRIFLGHPKIELSPGPGTVLPQLVHGGPGRAGGGEELGGPRGLAFYMQRVALEGSRPVIQKLLSR